ncbi:MAG: transglutaminase domain-containing protein [Fimbriimonadaceae bacterium]|nr:transglutaminase domain-containing protein [Fimbriimonadaceae bacterium]QYK57645.1 MAG: transglutaminase domain-containing protein [Fimbriimonadaceae bacterium]
MLFAKTGRLARFRAQTGHRAALVLALLLAAAVGWAQASWFGLYMRGQLIGYSRYEETQSGGLVTMKGQTLIQGRLLGSDLDIKIESTTESRNGRPTRMKVVTESGGRLSRVMVQFHENEAVATSAQDGRETVKRVTVPKGALVVSDPLEPGSLDAAGTSGKVYVFDTSVLALIECRVEKLGRQSIDVRGREVTLEAVRIHDPRATLTAYLSSKGDLVKATGPMGMEVYPADETVVAQLGARPDIAGASKIVPIRPLVAIESQRAIRYRITGADLSKAPDDLHQTLTGAGQDWTLEVHPDGFRGVAPAIIEETDRWLEPDVNIPSDTREMRDLAKSKAGNGTEGERAERLRLFVHDHVGTNAGIGILRDAREILETGEGVCRDHAVLLTTLLRASDIPARVVAGLVYMDDAFYYHAWSEALIEGKWVGLDSTRPSSKLTPTHIKLAQGTVAEAFTSFLLEGASIEPLNQRPKGDS